MQVEVVGAERASRCNFFLVFLFEYKKQKKYSYDFFQKIINFSKRQLKLTIYLKCPSITRAFFCSFGSCGQYVKKSGRIILVAFPAT